MDGMTLKEAFTRRRSCRSFEDRAVPRSMVAAMLWAAMGATNDAGNRTVPSAHALYPLRSYLAARQVAEMKPGLYGADQGCIGEVLLEDDRICQRLCEAALEDQPWVAEAAFVVAVCGDFKLAADAFAEQPPVGSRGARYVYLEAGAMMQNMQLSGVGLGLASVPVAGFDDEQVAAALALSSGLSPVVLLCCGWPSS